MKEFDILVPSNKECKAYLGSKDKEFSIFAPSIEEYKAYVKANNTEYESYIKDIVTGCDVIIRSLIYRDGLSATTRMIIDCCVQALSYVKYIELDTGSDIEIKAKIDELLEICYIALRNDTDINASAEISAIGFTELYPNIIEIDSAIDNDGLIASSLLDLKSTIELALSDVDIFISKSINRIDSELAIDSQLIGFLNRVNLRTKTIMEIDAKSKQENVTKKININNPTDVGVFVRSLSRRYYMAASTALDIAAKVISIDTAKSLGKGSSEIEFKESIDGVPILDKLIDINSSIDILIDISEEITKFIEAQSEIIISTDAQFILRRWKYLYEFDDLVVADMDNEILEDLDYITL